MTKCVVACGVSKQVNPKVPVIQEQAKKPKSHSNLDKGLNWYLGWK